LAQLPSTLIFLDVGGTDANCIAFILCGFNIVCIGNILLCITLLLCTRLTFYPKSGFPGNSHNSGIGDFEESEKFHQNTLYLCQYFESENIVLLLNILKDYLIGEISVN